ncbi:hypothetical protein ACFPM4_16345 [Lederbergia graminis]|uniref:Response regulatory domain-containing protein n=2 Tax=Lederbergia graminis TaxID=735518 RepID=A0ABW0LKF1_9BACI
MDVKSMERKKVLVVEDIKQMFLLYRYCLDSHFDVHMAKSFKDVQNFENKDDVVVTILDYHIPGESFENILTYIKDNYPFSKRLLISGHADSLGLQEKYGNDLDGVFSKPLDDYTKLAGYLVDLVGPENLQRSKV